jgi:glycosyltransferase involved in cell wall biosynthesis
VALPSRYEGLSNALIEALAAGIPVLASDCPWGARTVLAGASDRVTEAWPVTTPVRLTHGVLMPLPDDPTAIEIWAKEIVAALQAPVKRRSRLQRQQAIARFDIEHTGPQWLALAREISRQPASSSPGDYNR